MTKPSAELFSDDPEKPLTISKRGIGYFTGENIRGT
jgi:hypothetical protein